MSVNDFMASVNSSFPYRPAVPVFQQHEADEDNVDKSSPVDAKGNFDDDGDGQSSRLAPVVGVRETSRLAQRLRSQEAARVTARNTDAIRDVLPTSNEPPSSSRHQKLENTVCFEGHDTDCKAPACVEHDVLSQSSQSANVSPSRPPAHKRSKPSPPSPVRPQQDTKEMDDVLADAPIIPTPTPLNSSVSSSKPMHEVDTKDGCNAGVEWNPDVEGDDVDFIDILASTTSSSALGRLNVLSRKMNREQAQARADEEAKKKADAKAAEAKKVAERELGSLQIEPTIHKDSPRKKLTSSYSFKRRSSDDYDTKQDSEEEQEAPITVDTSCVDTTVDMTASVAGVSGNGSVGETSCSLDSTWKPPSEASKRQNTSMNSSSVFGSPRKVALLKRQNSLTKSNLKGLLMSGYKATKVDII
jgi:hypothetical protein